jgi:uncharacterized protein
MSERSGVEIDYCPQCRGVWLDRGELDKIIDRVEMGAAAPATPATPAAPPPMPPQPGHVPPPLYNLDPRRDDPRRDDRRPDDRRYDERRDRPRYDQPRYDDRRRPKKKEGWLGELFDF